MMYQIDDLTLDQINLIALAMDYFVCNCPNNPVKTQAEDLFSYLDSLVESIEESITSPVVTQTDNLIIVDFNPKD